MSKEVATQVATYLLEIKAVKLNPIEPFTWTSGWRSPIYCDNRVTLSHHVIRTYIKQELVNAIRKNFGTVTAIAGVATAGIAQGALVAEAMQLPYAYVRPEPKKHGMKNQIEGQLPAGSNVVVIEDLISTGGSSLKAIEALREEGFNVLGLAAIFTYGFDLASQQFENANCKMITLCDYNALLKVAVELDYINVNILDDLSAWRSNPSQWRQ
ncbi:MAG: orotate phosphoribosyltransferase [Bacteroidetes bacterium]|nr:orotate phosphoribosyltransferase [Bacteroidota bacterium]